MKLLLSMLAVTARGPNHHIARADPGHQEHSEAAVVESREPQPCPAGTCYCHVSALRSPRLAPASLLRLRARVCGCALQTGRTQSPAVQPTRLVPRALHRPPRLGIAPLKARHHASPAVPSVRCRGRPRHVRQGRQGH
jgi:hypothetical protein